MLTKEYIQSLGIEYIVNYLRKSRQDIELEKRTGEDTLKTQADLMDRVLRPLSVPYVQLPEIGSGDKISTRPIFQSIITDLGIGKYQAIAVKEISRMGRGSYTDMGIIYDLIVERRIFIITPYKVYDPNNPADLRQIRFEMFLSREEFETTSERLAGGRLTRALEGRWMAGKPPFGYDKDPITHKLIINEEEAAIVRLLFDMYVNGLKIDGEVRDVRFRAISTYFTRIGIPTPNGGRHWRPENLQYMIENEAYIGIVEYSGTIIEGAHEAIIDGDVWNRAQEKLQSKTSIPRTRIDRQSHELTGLVRCSCGNMMIRNAGVRRRKSQKTGEVKEYTKEILWCKNVNCGAVGYREVVNDIEHLLHRLINLDDQQIIQYIESGGKRISRQQDHQNALKFADKRREQLQAKLKFIHDQYEEQFYDRDTFIERKFEVEKELERVTKILQSGGDAVPDEEITVDDATVVRQNISSILDVYHKLDRGQKNKLLHAMFYEVVVKKISKGTGKKKPTFDIYTIPKVDLTKFNFFDLISI